MSGNGKTSRCASLLEWDGCCGCGEGSLKVGGRQSRRAWRPYYFRPVSAHRNLQTSVIGSLSDLHIYIQSLFTPKRSNRGPDCPQADTMPLGTEATIRIPSI